MKIQENIPLAEYTTFKIGGPARFFCVVENEKDLLDAVAFAEQKKLTFFILGGGSNVLMSDKGFEGLVMKMEIGGIMEQEVGSKKEGESQKSLDAPLLTSSSILLTCGAGVQWDTFVEYAVEHGLYGVENLSAIPGTVGAAPVQNIGAYGTEASQTIHSVRAFDTRAGKFVEITNADCRFAYRDSLFKREKGRYIITQVTFALKKDGVVNIEYRDVKEYFEKVKSESQNPSAGSLLTPYSLLPAPSLHDVRAAIIDIRWNKLPDWKLWGTAGSFFKNPLICTEHYEGLKKKYPDLPGFPETKDVVKVPLGWILDKICGMKGVCVGNVCVYEKQALVLVAKSGATSEQVVKLARDIMKAVKEKTDIDVEAEVEWVN